MSFMYVNRELEGERALLRTVLERMPAGLVVAAPSEKLLLGNPQMEAVLGRPLSQDDCLEHYGLFLGRHGDGGPFARKDYPLARCLTRGEMVSNEGFGFIRTDGSTGFVQVSAAPVRKPSGGNHRRGGRLRQRHRPRGAGSRDPVPGLFFPS